MHILGNMFPSKFNFVFYQNYLHKNMHESNWLTKKKGNINTTIHLNHTWLILKKKKNRISFHTNVL